ncbi:MAG: SHOCT domain-containing protein [Gordonia sp. (in: high G+C Gram-positive bacteria)]
MLPPNVSVVAGQTGADPVQRLEKLAGLRDAGIVTDDQFAQLRAQILEQAGLDDSDS